MEQKVYLGFMFMCMCIVLALYAKSGVSGQRLQTFTNNTDGAVIVQAFLDDGSTKSITIKSNQRGQIDAGQACISQFIAQGTSGSIKGQSDSFRPIRSCGEHSLHLSVRGGKLRITRLGVGSLHQHNQDHVYHVRHQDASEGDSLTHEIVHEPVNAALGVAESILP